MRSIQRPRRYVARQWLLILGPVLRHSPSRDAYVLHVVGNRWGPVLRLDRRRQAGAFDGIDRRRPAPRRAQVG